MHAAVMARVAAHDVFIAVAAVADYRPARTIGQKIKKGAQAAPPAIELVLNPDILAEVAALPEPPLCVGFAAESENLAEYAEHKRRSKGIPLIVGNLIQDGFGGDDNTLILFDDDGQHPLAPAPRSCSPGNWWRASPACSRNADERPGLQVDIKLLDARLRDSHRTTPLRIGRPRPARVHRPAAHHRTRAKRC
jgi:hypothetical protein